MVQAQGYTEEFNAWYATYPRKVSKFNAYKSYQKVIKEWWVTEPELLEKTKEFAEWCSFTGRDTQYIAHPTTWLNQHRWEDELAHV